MIRFHKLSVAMMMLLLVVIPVLAFKVPIHLEITKTVLKSISKTVGSNTYQFTDKAIEEVMKANQGVDECVSCQFHSEFHFDGENFSGGSKRLVDLKSQILKDLSGSSPNGAKAREHLGQALHTLQDFYAHSNRVEAGLSTFDAQLGVSTFTGEALTDKACPNDPAVLGDKGLTIATSGYFPLPSPCNGKIPANKCRHGNDETFHVFDTCDGINKDSPTSSSHGRQFFQQAHDLAVTATTRFVNDLILNDPSITNNAKAVKALMGVSTTLGMVVDTTGSMGDVIGSVQSNIGSIVNSVVGTPDEPDQYLLEPFNDPTFGPPTTTSDAPTFLAQVNSLFASGGGDCPELAMHGLQEAVNTADEQSTLFLFTDASAKDSGLFPNVDATATKKKITVNFALFGSCSPIDPAFINTASATGGQVFFFNRFTEKGAIFPLMQSQIGGPQVNILHDAATISTSRDIPFPVDSMITSLSVSTSLDSVSAITLTRPDGTVVSAADAGVILTRVGTGAIFVIASPPQGNWNLHVEGSGALSVDVRGKSSRALLRQVPNLSSFNFVILTGRIGHSGYFPIPGQPVVGDTQTVVARLNGVVTNAAFSLVTEAGGPLQSLTLNQGDPNAIPDDFVGTISLPTQPFRVVAIGKDANGAPFQRTIPALFRPETVRVTPTTFLEDGLPQGQTVSLVYEVQNSGAADTFNLAATDGQSFVTSTSPSSLTLASGATGTVTVNLSVPVSAALGTDDSITVVATSATNAGISNSAVQTFEVAGGDTTPPTITVAADPASLWPPNNKLVTVTVSGTMTDTQSGVNPNSGTFTVTDEYGTVQPSGTFTINADGSYAFTVQLEASRQGDDLDGRLYTITVQGSDNAGNAGSATTTVVVPHDQGH
ncbi:MAG TPA: hypothetical protein VK699_08395 [Terriglobales bacterium]|jgi:hypothetical protein|nr:hypothetical protein [Terriglobales bacterium]